MNISKNIIAIREAKRIKQIEVANVLNIEQSNYARLEKRDVEMSIKQLSEIAVALGVTVDDILHYGEEKPQIVDNEKVKELENKVLLLEKETLLLKETIDLQKKLIEKQEKIEKLTAKGIISMLAIIRRLNPEAYTEIKRITINKIQEQDLSDNIAIDIYNLNEFFNLFDNL
jgi:transcriptional regulator with XRE-family HTH domain